MKYITINDFNASYIKIWQYFPNDNEMVITNQGKPIALLTPISDFDLEETVKTIRRVKAKQAVKQMQEISLMNNNSAMTEIEIQREIVNVIQVK